MIDLNTRPR